NSNWVNRGVTNPNTWINIEVMKTSSRTRQYGLTNSNNCQNGVLASSLSFTPAVGWEGVEREKAERRGGYREDAE
ncbi:MAG: hypothetical protein PUP92_34610, partial [Rhizonema sp. PD38]|nr:hypothetical protein [Rhizonema sp. PD38]